MSGAREGPDKEKSEGLYVPLCPDLTDDRNDEGLLAPNRGGNGFAVMRRPHPRHGTDDRQAPSGQRR